MKLSDFESAVVLRARYPAFSFPNLLNAVFLFSKEVNKEIGNNLLFAGFVFKDNKRIGLLGNKTDIDQFQRRVFKKVFFDKNYINRHYKLFNRRKLKLIKYCRNNLIKSKISKLNNKQLYQKLKRYYLLYQIFSAAMVKFLYFDVDERLEKEVKGLIKPEHHFLLNCPELTYAMQYECDYYKECTQLSKKLSHKWGWIPFDYTGITEWDQEYFLRKMNVDLEKIKQILSTNKILRKKQKVVLTNYNKNTRRLLKDFHTVSIMKDQRKWVTTLSHTYLVKNLYHEITNRTGLKKEHLMVMIPLEVKNALNGKDFDKQLFDKRIEKGLILLNEDGFTVYESNHPFLKKLISFIPKKKEIKGITASKGKVKGVVKVCLTSKEISKVNLGDILVAPMTTPDYVPAMNKAAGFITDEGGITCHAAIVAREMNKPCIIGTHSATDLLKDGDVIELNADKGTIKKF
jgi:phosphohistidine swiveling domain-containing protein